MSQSNPHNYSKSWKDLRDSHNLRKKKEAAKDFFLFLIFLLFWLSIDSWNF